MFIDAKTSGLTFIVPTQVSSDDHHLIVIIYLFLLGSCEIVHIRNVQWIMNTKYKKTRYLRCTPYGNTTSTV